MAGSQLKQLKAALKESGLTGQQNIKRKNANKRAPSDMRRDDRQEVINKIRDQFNPFEIKTNKQKSDRDYKTMKGAQGKPGISKQVGEDQRKLAYDSKKAKKGKNGGLLDKRFGERNSDLTAEEKMLERFTRERQMQASKSDLYNLDSDDDQELDEFSGGLTHYGKSLALNDDFEQDDDLNPSDDEIFKPKKKQTHKRDDPENENSDVPRKKTKAEVMKEVIAKSKFYKQQRQLQKEQNNEKIMDLDEEFEDVLEELGSIPKPKAPQFTEPSTTGINYEKSIKELNMEKRAAPAERTKTEDEIKRERMAKMRELEEARLRRMRGEAGDHAEKGPDELDDDFWLQGSDEEGFAIKSSDEEGSNEEDNDKESSDSEDEQRERPKSTKKQIITCPSDHEELLEILSTIEFKETVSHINKILATYAPQLQIGNKEKTAKLTVILFEHILYLAEFKTEEQINDEEFVQVEEDLIKIVKKLSEKYNLELSAFIKIKIQEIHERVQETINQPENEEDVSFPLVSDLVFFSLIGLIYSTSDHYHLIVTPVQIIMGEILNQLKFDTLEGLVCGVFISDIFLKYQRFSKRFIPEVAAFLEKALLSLITPESLIEDKGLIKPDADFELSFKDHKPITLKLTDLTNLGEYDESAVKLSAFNNILSLLEYSLDLWKDKSAFIEIFSPFHRILNAIIIQEGEVDSVSALSLKIKRLLSFAQDDRKPLALQVHKKLAIASLTPKFEENFNPDKKSYDEDRSRAELNKMRKQIKQERKFTMKELRKDTRFEARQQISEKKAQYKEYHTKMARIMNTINTIEGSEKNEYEREKKQRKNKK